MCLRCDTNIALCAKGSAEMREIMKRNHTKILSVILTAALIGSLIASPTTAGAAKKLKAVSPKSVTAGKSIKVKVNMKCKFKSSNKKIATVSSKGVVKGKKAGKVKITVTAKKNKQRKTVKITVKKKDKKVVTKTPSTAAPSVSTTHPPQDGVTQTPKPSEGVSQTPSVPQKSSNPATGSPDVPAPETPPATSAPGPIGTETPSPDLSSTPKPSVSPVPTSTATPSMTKQPIGITAEFEGKLPLNSINSNQDVTLEFVNKNTVITTVKYSDNTEKKLKSNEITVGEGKVIEDNDRMYAVKDITYEEFSTTLRVEIIKVDAEVLYPDSIMCTYQGGTLKEGEYPDLKDIKTEAIYDYNTIKVVESDQLNINLLYDSYVTAGVKEYRFELNYNYFFEFNGEILHSYAADSVYISYE